MNLVQQLGCSCSSICLPPTESVFVGLCIPKPISVLFIATNQGRKCHKLHLKASEKDKENQAAAAKEISMDATVEAAFSH